LRSVAGQRNAVEQKSVIEQRSAATQRIAEKNAGMSVVRSVVTNVAKSAVMNVVTNAVMNIVMNAVMNIVTNVEIKYGFAEPKLAEVLALRKTAGIKDVRRFFCGHNRASCWGW